jgi:hypothetical protein
LHFTAASSGGFDFENQRESEMRNRIAHLLATVLLCVTAQADIVTYTITGATGNNWSGQFEVVNLNLAASSWDFEPNSNIIGVTADEWSQVNSFYFGSNAQGLIQWNNFSGQGLKLQSPDLYSAISSGATWNQLIGDTYTITSTDYNTEFKHPTEGTLSGTGGQISFAAVPEPATALTLGLGGLLIAGYRRLSKSYGRF